MIERLAQIRQLESMCDDIAKAFASQNLELESWVREALMSVNRIDFVSDFSHLAYELNPLPIQGAQFISSPLTVAKMTQYLGQGDSVLEVGLGSGYQAMVLAKAGFRRVFSIERIERLLLQAREKIRASGVLNINTKFGDGQSGWAEYAPYDRILLSACLEDSVPSALIKQLEEGGILLAPMLEERTTPSGKVEQRQVIKRFLKNSGRLVDEEVLEDCLFVPIVKGTMQ
ncbi:protein-L-isoaspartate O-methyltransferase [Helicobacter macacae MIT 99-5501]|uniref:Protein-L-isoaspartate O-methyltransferase n=2 Tax=Helicobacter TaxID=209 RepID=V8C7V7_9HELI|nr:protein-L-isoaspartate O-methyltransferase [Helicobacter macacae MIT 99-5501]